MTQMAKRGLVAAGVAVALAAAPFIVRAQGEGGPMRGRHGFIGGGFVGMRQLGLTDDQRQQIRAAMSSHQDECKAVFERIRQAREAQQEAIDQVPLNEAQIRAASSELAAAEADAAVLRARVHEQIFSMLTPDQQTKAKTLAAERKQFRAQRRAEWKQRMEQFKQQQQQPNQAAPQPQQ